MTEYLGWYVMNMGNCRDVLEERLQVQQYLKTNELRHEISNNVVHVASKDSDQTANMCCLIRAFASGLNILC